MPYGLRLPHTAYAEADRKRREAIDLRNNADQLVFNVEKTMNEMGDKVPANMKDEINVSLGTAVVIKILTVDKVALVEVERHEVSIRKPGVTLE